MSIFGAIVSKIFGHANAAPAPSSSSTAAPLTTGSSSTASGPAPTSFNNPAPSSASPGGSSASPAPSTSASPGSSAAAPQTVDVTAVLDDMLKTNGQNLDWRHSIVDLMKLLGLDSSLTARQELAKELNYTGSTSDSASMNIWLHKQVMQKLAANGGKVPAELKD